MRRREFIKTIIGIAAGLYFAGARRLSGRTDRLVFNIGSLEDYPPGTVKNLRFRDAFIVSDREGVYALSSICTHHGGSLVAREGLLRCPRHRSLFDLEGGVVRGPAREPLPWLRLELVSGRRLQLYRRYRGERGKKIPRG